MGQSDSCGGCMSMIDKILPSRQTTDSVTDKNADDSNDINAQQTQPSHRQLSTQLPRIRSIQEWRSVDEIQSEIHALNQDMDNDEPCVMMKSVALIAHNHMKPSMREFVREHQDVLAHFELIGTKTTLQMVCHEMEHYYKNGKLKIGRKCSSGPFGGDAEISSELVNGNVGCIIFFVDPVAAHPHQADVHSLLRLARVHNVLLATNQMSGTCIIEALQNGIKDKVKMPKSMFRTFHTLSPAVGEYMRRKSVLSAKTDSQTAKI
eukprot:214386_1